MACPQCGGALQTYSLGGREASVCEDCGYVGIAADHKGDPVVVESWDDALRRFYAEHGEDADPRVELTRSDVAEQRRDGESWEEALERFYAEHGANETSVDDEATGDEVNVDDEAIDDEATPDDEAIDDEATPDDDSSEESHQKRDVDDADDESEPESESAVSPDESGAPASQSSADGS
jgi:hypothetical protein